VRKIEESLPQFEIGNLILRETDCLTFGPLRDAGTFPPDLVEKMAAERDDIRRMVESADERL
jgi:hypothetical protein